MKSICDLKLAKLQEMKIADGVIERKTEIVNVKQDMFNRFLKFKETQKQKGAYKKVIDPVERSKRI